MNTALLWNTYARDLDWFRYSASSYAKFGKGRWSSVACLVPSSDRHLFKSLCAQHQIHLADAPDWPEAGFNWHQLWQCQADLLFPSADAIWHMDSDCVFSAPVGPENWMRGDKLVCPFITFDHLLSVNTFGPGMWKQRVDAAIGGGVKLSTMTGHPHCHYRGVYSAVRRAVEASHPQLGWEAYVRSCENTYPQGFCEFETLGAMAQREFHNHYHWINLLKEAHPTRGLVLEGWSHGGLDLVTDRFDGKRTARQVFEELGL